MNLELCLEFLDYFGIGYSENTIELDSDGAHIKFRVLHDDLIAWNEKIEKLFGYSMPQTPTVVGPNKL